MSFIPAMRFLVTIPISGFFLLIFWSVLTYLLPFAPSSNVKSFLTGLFLIAIPFSILIGGGIKAIIDYQKERYKEGTL